MKKIILFSVPLLFFLASCKEQKVKGRYEKDGKVFYLEASNNENASVKVGDRVFIQRNPNSTWQWKVNNDTIGLPVIVDSIYSGNIFP